MRAKSGKVFQSQKFCFNTHMKYSIILPMIITIILSTFGTGVAKADWPQIVKSKDGTQISFEVYGAGEPTLIFVHGWSCDMRYWRNQVPKFSINHRVVVLDLAGHGHSGMTRTDYTMHSFGQDVEAVADAVDSSSYILVGHSMGGVVIAEAARLMPESVIGLIGIDTLGNIEYPLTEEELDQMIAPLKEDFRTGSQGFVKQMFRSDSDPNIQEWVLADMSSASSNVALSAMHEMMSLYISGEMAKMFENIRVPVVTVNADMWPIDYEANRRHMFSFDAIVVKESDHFLMMNRPDDFNNALEKAISMVLQKQAPS